MSERKGKTLVGDDWASFSKFQRIKKNVQVSSFWQGMLHCVTPVQEICFFASVDFTGKYFLSESAMFPDRRRSDSCRKFLGQLFIWLPPPENYKSPSGCRLLHKMFQVFVEPTNCQYIFKKSMLMLLLNFHFHSFFYFHQATPLSHPTGPLRPVWSWCITNKPFVKWQK